MTLPLVSVIVPVYNVETLLERCVRSILNQTYTHLEILLVDDGSKDNSGKICDSFSKIDRRVSVIHQGNGGASSARNAGLDACTGEFILFVDSDDFLEPTLVAECLHSSETQTADIVIFNFSHEKNTVSVENPLKLSAYSNSQAIFEGVLWDWVPSYPFKFYKRLVWKGIRFPVGTVWEDFIVMPDVFRQSRKNVLLNKVLYHYETSNPVSVSRRIKSINKYGMFLGWKKRKEIAAEIGNQELQRWALIRTLRLAVTALGLNTHDCLLSEAASRELEQYLHENTRQRVPGIGMKYSFLLWSLTHCPYLLTVYGQLTYALANIKKCWRKPNSSAI